MRFLRACLLQNEQACFRFLTQPLSAQKLGLRQEIEKADLEDSVVIERCSGEIFGDEDFPEGVSDQEKGLFPTLGAEEVVSLL